MSTHSYETLVAFADGELQPEERSRVARELANDDDGRRIVYLLRFSRLCVDRLYDEALGALSPPARLWGPARSTTQPWLDRGRSWIAVPVGMAALLIGLAGGYLLHDTLATGSFQEPQRTSNAMLGMIPAGTPIADALSFGPTQDDTWLIAGGGRIVTADRFRDQYGNRCRELQVFTPPGGQVPAEIVVACRLRRGEWSAVAAVATRSKAQSVEAIYAPTGTEVRTAVDGVLAMIGAERAQEPNSKESTTQ